MEFVKYHGAGNDFIIIDGRDYNCFSENNNKPEIIRELCNRHTGVGADGLIEFKESESYDFRMIYYNSDGREGTMCGNGGRCVAAFAWHEGIAGESMVFEASDGLHEAKIIKSDDYITMVDLKLGDVLDFKINDDYIVVDTGSPHYVVFVDNVKDLNVFEKGRKIRYDNQFSPKGINVNFAGVFDDHIFVRTYERGVEDETMSCGTGVTAAAIAAFLKGIQFEKDQYPVKTKGGELLVKFKAVGKNTKFENVWLKGEAVKVFEGFAAIK